MNRYVSSETCTRPGLPSDSIMLASVTSCDQTSNLKRRVPTMPHSTVPVCTPTRMFTCTAPTFQLVVRQVVWRLTYSDNWLDTSGYGTNSVRQVVGDNWRKHGWLATRGFSHIDLGLSAVNMTLPAFAAECCAAVPALQQSIAIYCRSGNHQQIRSCCGRSVGQMDGRTLDRFIDPAPCTKRPVSTR